MKPWDHLQLGEAKLLPGQEWTEEAEGWRFLRVGSGSAYWLDQVRPRALTEGEVVVLAPGAKGVVRASQLTEVVLHGFKFVPDLLCGFFTLAERHYFQSEASTLAAVQFLPSTHPVTRHFVALASHHATRAPLVARAAVLGLVAEFFGDAMSRHTPPAARSGSADQRFQQLIVHMPDLEMIQHPLEELARLCGCSPRHFNRLFRKHFGEPPRARQTELRLAKAGRLLAATDEKIIQVALDCGYHSLSLFNALFKRRFGVSPSAWRQKNGLSKPSRKTSSSSRLGRNSHPPASA